MSQNTPTFTELKQAESSELAEVISTFERLVSGYVGLGQLPTGTDNFSLNEQGQYSHVPTLLLWQLFQLGYASRMEKAVELPKEVAGVMIEHMPKGSGFRAGFDFLVKDLLKKGVNLK